jgi:hypothetical protein
MQQLITSKIIYLLNLQKQSYLQTWFIRHFYGKKTIIARERSLKLDVCNQDNKFLVHV